MFEVGQKVTVIADKVISYDGLIQARAMSDSGLGAYSVASSAAQAAASAIFLSGEENELRRFSSQAIHQSHRVE